MLRYATALVLSEMSTKAASKRRKYALLQNVEVRRPIHLVEETFDRILYSVVLLMC